VTSTEDKLSPSGPHAKTWKLFVSLNPFIMQLLYKLAFNFETSIAVMALTLMTVACEQSRYACMLNLYSQIEKSLNSSSINIKEAITASPKSSSSDAIMEGQEEEIDLRNVMEIFKDFKILEHCINTFILEKNSHIIRMTAALFIKSIWENSSSERRKQIFNFLVKNIPHLHFYGSKAVEYFLLLNYLVNK
jgi:hypothetical protein